MTPQETLLKRCETVFKEVEAWMRAEMDEAEEQKHMLDCEEGAPKHCVLCKTAQMVEQLDNYFQNPSDYDIIPK